MRQRAAMATMATILLQAVEIGKFESDAAFWKFVGNPSYRMQEKSIVEGCRASEVYKKKLFEKIDLLIKS